MRRGWEEQKQEDQQKIFSRKFQIGISNTQQCIPSDFASLHA
jgi:hypothetical protein